MDKGTAVGIVLVVGAVGALAYVMYEKSKSTTTPPSGGQSYTVTLVNNCNQSVTVNYTDPNGNSQTLTIMAGTSPSVNVLAGSKITYTVNGQTYSVTANQNNQIINLCTSAVTGSYSVTLVNNCGIAITVFYNAPNGTVQSVSLLPGKSQTVSVLGGSQITYVLNNQWQSVTISSNQTVNLCGATGGVQPYTVEIYNACNYGIYVNYTDPSGNSSRAYGYPAAWLVLQVQPNSQITIYDDSGNQLYQTTVSNNPTSLVSCPNNVTQPPPSPCRKIGNQVICSL